MSLINDFPVQRLTSFRLQPVFVAGVSLTAACVCSVCVECFNIFVSFCLLMNNGCVLVQFAVLTAVLDECSRIMY